MDSGCILDEQPTQHFDEMHVGYERKRRIKS